MTIQPTHRNILVRFHHLEKPRIIAPNTFSTSDDTLRTRIEVLEIGAAVNKDYHVCSAGDFILIPPGRFNFVPVNGETEVLIDSSIVIAVVPSDAVPASSN